MKIIYTFILEDDAAMRTLLKGYVERTPGLVLVGTSGCPLEAGALMSAAPVDLLLLDIGLPELDGYGFLSTLPRAPAVIVVSADERHAVKAFDHAAVDFLIKPFGHERFLKAIRRADAMLHRPEPGSLPAQGIGKRMGNDNGNANGNANTNGTIMLKIGKRMVPVRLDQIEAVQSVGNYVKVYLPDNHLLASSTMQAMEGMLPADRFVRVHRTWIVAYRCIQAVDAHGVEWHQQQLPFGGLYKRQAQASIRAHLSGGPGT